MGPRLVGADRCLAAGLPFAVVACLLCAAAIASTSSAGRAPGLCKMDSSRGTVAKKFAIDACFDGTGLWLRNDLSVPVEFTTSGDTGSVTNLHLDLGLAASATRKRYSSRLLLLPHDIMKIAIGPGPARVTLANTKAGGFYALATTVAAFLPGGVVKAAFDSFTGLIAELNDDFAKSANCRASHSEVVCGPILSRDVAFALGRATVTGLARGAASVILQAATFLKWADGQPSAVAKILGSTRTIAINAFGGRPSTFTDFLDVDFASKQTSIDGVDLLDSAGPPFHTGAPNVIAALTARLGPPSDCSLLGGSAYDKWWVTSWSKLGLRVFTQPAGSGPLPDTQPCGGDARARFESLDIFVAFLIDDARAQWTVRTDQGSFVVGSSPSVLPQPLRTTGTSNPDAWGLGRQTWSWAVGVPCAPGVPSSAAWLALFDYEGVGSTLPFRLNAVEVDVPCG